MAPSSALRPAYNLHTLILFSSGWHRAHGPALNTRARAYKHRAYKHLLEQLLLLELQLQHDGVELHVQVVGSLQLPLVVLPDVQSMPAGPAGRTEGLDAGGTL